MSPAPPFLRLPHSSLFEQYGDTIPPFVTFMRNNNTDYQPYEPVRDLAQLKVQRLQAWKKLWD